MTMIMWDDVDALARETVPFGSDDTVERVLLALASHENADVNAVLYGTVDVNGAVVAVRALAAKGRMDVAARHFKWSGSYWMNAEDAATLFEALTDYAMGESVCDATTDTHASYVREVCNCNRRELARSWSAYIAMIAAGLQVV